eukprot:CFRG3897T1
MSGAIYGGEETGAVVFEVGAYETKAGIAGEDLPSCLFSSSSGYLPAPAVDGMDTDHVNSATKKRKPYYVGHHNSIFREGMNIKCPVEDGVIVDWDLYEAQLDYALSELNCDSTEHPVLIGDEAWSQRDQREKLTEVLFEKYGTPAYFLGKKPVLSAFANGRSNALVFDMGLSGGSVVPVYEGYAVQKGITRTKLSANLLMNTYQSYLESSSIAVVPKFLVAKRGDSKTKVFNYKLKETEGVTPSYKQYKIREELRDFHEHISQVSDTQFDDSALQHIPTVPYEFSTGYEANIGATRFQTPGILFNPKSCQPTTGRNLIDLNDSKYNLGISELIMQSVSKCDADIHSNLYNNIVITGGTTLIPGFVERLQNDLAAVSPVGMKVRLVYTSGQERRHSSWIGGSILGCLGAFQQMWISKQEYEESGKSFVEKKCA